MRVCFTGEMSLDRAELERRAVAAGIRVTGSVVGKTDVLVVADAASMSTQGSPYTRARHPGAPRRGRRGRGARAGTATTSRLSALAKTSMIMHRSCTFGIDVDATREHVTAIEPPETKDLTEDDEDRLHRRGQRRVHQERAQ
jgi:hypothetical protein